MTMKDIISSPLLAVLAGIGLLYIVGFSLVYLKKSYQRCIELGITKEELSKVIKSSLIFSIVPSLSIVVGLFVLSSALGTVWSWWRLSVIGSLSYETLISDSVAKAIGFTKNTEMLANASTKLLCNESRLAQTGKPSFLFNHSTGLLFLPGWGRPLPG